MSPEAYEAMAALQARHWWFTARREVLRSALRGLSLPPRAVLTEIGCGPGGNLGLLGEFGRVQAVEMDAGARQHAAQNSGVSVLAGHLPEALPAELERADAVCLFDVLEHVQDDAGALRALHALLKPGGRLVLTVPAGPWMYGPHDRAHHHYRRYTADALRGLATAQGWRVLRLTHFNTWLYPLVALARALQRDDGSARSDTHLPAPWLNRLLHAVFASEAAVLPHLNLPIGVSLLAVLEPAPGSHPQPAPDVP